MKIDVVLLAVAAVVCSVSVAPAIAKTAKECTAEWRADKAGMQARGVTEKAYVAGCKVGTEPTLATPTARPTATPSLVPRQATPTGSKTAKECTAEWRADKAGMKAQGVTEKAYVEQCKSGAAPSASAPSSKPNGASSTPAAPSSSASTSSSRKTAKECITEWRADKAGMQARGITEKAYVEECKAGGAVPSATAPAPKPAAAAPSPSRAAPTTTQAPAPQNPVPTTTAAPTPAPTPQTSVRRDNATLEAGQFSDEASAKARCPSDTVVWVNLPSKIYHFAGTRSYGTTKRGAYMCEKDAIAAEDRASKTEKHP